MALTQVFPKFEASLVDFDKGAVVPRCRPPVGLEFRSGGALDEFADRLLSQRYCTVNAAPGAGKSTKLPVAVAARAECLVLLVLPFTPLAAVTHARIVKTIGTEPVAYVDDVSQQYPDRGLCVTSAAQVVARWLQEGRPGLPSCVVLHDESHESGVASATLRAFLPSLSTVRTYALMSATGSLEPSRPMETGGEVVERTFQPEVFQDPWSVEEDGAPWSAFELPGHILIFEDDKTRAASLMQAYNYNGVAACRLHAGSSAKEVLGVFRQFDDPRANGLHAFIVDSTYRSGYTFPASVVVDSGVVRRMVAQDGRPKVASRSLYEFERVQSRSRAGRVPGTRAMYWRPVGVPANVLCDLEQTDMEAYALVLRALGYRPTPEVARTRMARGPIPYDLCAALRGHLPLSCLPDHELRALDVQPAPVVEPVPEVREVVPAVEPVVSHDETAQDVLAGIFSSLQMRRERVQLGDFCVARGLCTTDASSLDFPDGVASVFRVLGVGARVHVHHSWSDYQRSVALNALISSHNIELLQWRAWVRVLKYAKTRTSARDSASLHRWAVRCAEEASRLGARVETALGAIIDISGGYVDVNPAGALLASEEERFYQALVRDFDGVAVVDDSRAVDQKKLVQDWVGEAERAVQASSDSRKRIGHAVTGPGGAGVPSWLLYSAGYTGNVRARVERISDGRSEGSGSRSASLSVSTTSSGKKRLSFVR